MNRINVFILLVGVFCMLMTSCGSVYTCTVNAFGTIPESKGYYLIPEDSALADDLEFKEYASILKQRLSEVGYVEVSSSDAALCIRLSYQVGEEKYMGENSYTSSNSQTTTKRNVNSTTTSNALYEATGKAFGGLVETNAKANASSTTNTQTKEKSQNLTFTNTSTTAVYETPVRCKIVTTDNQTAKPIWSVEVFDKINYSKTFRESMPWMLLAAQEYFGKSGESNVSVDEKVGLAKGLKYYY